MSPTIGNARGLRATVLPAALAPAAAAVGGADFYRELLAGISGWLRADLAMVMRYSDREVPEYLVHEGLAAHHMDLYLGGLYRVDPMYRLCRERSISGVKGLHELCTPAEKAGEYFSIFLRLTGMADDLAILFAAGEHTTIGLVFERRTAFSRGETRTLGELFPLLEAIHSSHQRVSSAGEPFLRGGSKGRRETAGGAQSAPGLPPIEYRHALDTYLRGQLTPRERDIVGLVFAGYPNAKIAERLKLSINTIKNHKKRMYFKLDITTERELFMNFVTFLFKGA